MTNVAGTNWRLPDIGWFILERVVYKIEELVGKLVAANRWGVGKMLEWKTLDRFS